MSGLELGRIGTGGIRLGKEGPRENVGRDYWNSWTFRDDVKN